MNKVQRSYYRKTAFRASPAPSTLHANTVVMKNIRPVVYDTFKVIPFIQVGFRFRKHFVLATFAWAENICGRLRDEGLHLRMFLHHCAPCWRCRPLLSGASMLRPKGQFPVLATWFVDLRLLLCQRWGRGLLSLGWGFPRRRHIFYSSSLRSSVQAFVPIPWVLRILDFHRECGRSAAINARRNLHSWYLVIWCSFSCLRSETDRSCGRVLALMKS